MKIKLSEGKSAMIDVQFGEEKPKLERPLPDEIANEPFRSVRMEVTVHDKKGRKLGQLIGVSYCNPLDQFCRSEGRKLAMRRIFEFNRGSKKKKKKYRLLSKKDCRLISPVLLRGQLQ